MPSIDNLLGHTPQQLRDMSDEEILTKWADCFKLEPVVLIKPKETLEEDSEPTEPKPKRKPTKNKIDKLQGELLDLAKMQEMLNGMKKVKL